MRIVGWIGCCLLLTMPAAVARPHATPSRTALHQAQARLVANAVAAREAARRDAARASGLRDQARRQATRDTARALALSQATVQAAGRLQQTEQQAAATTAQAKTLEQDRDQAAAELAADAKAMAPLLAVIERLSLYPAETLLAAPLPPEDSLTGLTVLRGLGRTLEQRAQAARQAQERVRVLSRQLDDQQARLAALRQDQAAQAQALSLRTDAARQQSQASTRQAENAARQAAAAASQASDLDGAVARIAAAEQAADRAFEQQAAAALPPIPAPARSDAASIVPVAGRLVQRFGDSTEAGPATGARFASAAGAVVTAPCTGRVEFAGPFRSYGQMLILDCGHDDRLVLAGLGGIAVRVSQPVARGAALGRMGDASPSLYVQARHGERTVDPGRFLRGG